jgi:CheY-like chemotaxis protein
MHTILLIDDEPDDLTLTSVLLSVEGYRTLRACEMRHAMVLATQSPPDVVVIDSVGFDAQATQALTLALGSDARTRHIPIIVLQESVEIEQLIDHIEDAVQS